MDNLLVNMVFIVFGILSCQLMLAFYFGRLFCSEHRFSKPAWLIAALSLAAGTFGVIATEWIFILAGVVATMGVLHIGFVHLVAIKQKYED